MENQNLMLYKLIILYMLDRIDEYSLTNTQITNFILVFYIKHTNSCRTLILQDYSYTD